MAEYAERGWSVRGKQWNVSGTRVTRAPAEGELEQNQTNRKFQLVRTEGKREVKREIDP